MHILSILKTNECNIYIVFLKVLLLIKQKNMKFDYYNMYNKSMTMIIFSNVINDYFYLVKRRENEHQQVEAYTAWVNSQLRKRPGMPLVQVY